MRVSYDYTSYIHALLACFIITLIIVIVIIIIIIIIVIFIIICECSTWKEQIPYTRRILTADHSAWVDLLTMKESSKFLDIHSGFCHLVKVTIVIILR